jgi:hypothetical protein
MTDSITAQEGASAKQQAPAQDTVAAGVLAPWQVAELPAPPSAGWRLWIGLIGPGVVLAGTSIGTGEWLFGPGVSAQYGATLFWLALSSIICQAFANLMMMRYAIYCGEPVIVGILRMRPGPMAWMVMFAILDFAAIWPYNASNAAVPLAAAIRGHLPNMESDPLVKGLGFAIFLLAFVPLIFGGTVYRMLEKIMTFKLVMVLGYLSIVAVTMVSLPVAWDVAKGFLSFGTAPVEPQGRIAGRHFIWNGNQDDMLLQGRVAGPVEFQAKGTWEIDKRTGQIDGTVTGELLVSQPSGKEKIDLHKERSSIEGELSPAARTIYDAILTRTKEYADTNRFFFVSADGPARLQVEGTIEGHHNWQPTKITVLDGAPREYTSLAGVPESYRSDLENRLKHESLAYVSMIGYYREHGRLPPLDWVMVVGFIAIAGAGGLCNTMFSNYARDKGWGMGRHVGAIPSAIGGVQIDLSHTGKVFRPDETSLARWRGWMRHILRDQWIWILASIIGMALPCMMSLEFIRNATVTGDRVAAMSAEGIAMRYPSIGPLFWFLTLMCGFLVLAPGQVSAGDQLARRWTDMIWTVKSQGGRSGLRDVRYVYYGILAGYCLCGLIILWFFPTLAIAKISTVLQNVALGVVALLSLYVNRVLMPKEIRPSWFLQLGVIACGVFFLGVSVAVLYMFL